MIGNSKVHHGMSAESLTVLKPHKLGRPHHKTPQRIKEAINKHSRLISDYFLRNYRVNIELTKANVQEQSSLDPNCLYRTEIGKAGFSIDRTLLTEVLECYYGGISPSDKDTPPISTSEQRMSSRLGADVIDIFARALLAGESFGELTRYENDYEEIAWEYVVELEYASHITNSTSSIFIYLDTDLADELIGRLSGPASPCLNSNPLDSIKRLPVRLDCVIATIQMPLAQVLELEPNDILMVRPTERYEVMINQQKLFRGAIFEDDGALYLTSLESVKSQ